MGKLYKYFTKRTLINNINSKTDYRTDYYDQFINSNIINCIDIYNDYFQTNIEKHVTQKEIIFEKIPFLSNPKQVIKQYGYPRFKHNSGNVDVYIYKRKIIKLQIFSVYYFLNNLFYFGEKIFFNAITHKEINILDNICNKYKIIPTEKKQITIYDTSNNVLSYHSGVWVTIKYFNHSDEMKKLLNICNSNNHKDIDRFSDSDFLNDIV